MVQYVLRRIFLMLPALLGVSVITFGLVKLAPGSIENMKFAASASEAGVDDAVRRLSDNLTRYQNGQPARAPWTPAEIP